MIFHYFLSFPVFPTSFFEIQRLKFEFPILIFEFPTFFFEFQT